MLRPATAAMKPALAARASPSAIAMVEPPTFEPQAFEAQGDPLQALILIGAILVPFGYWWLITVPEARIGLAKDKRLDTDLNEYLVELKEADARPVEKWFFDKWLQKARPAAPTKASTATMMESTTTTSTTTDDAQQQNPTDIAELFKPASLAGNATPKFFSGDNPIVVTMAVLLGLGVFATVSRTNSALAVDGLVVLLGVIFGLNRLSLK